MSGRRGFDSPPHRFGDDKQTRTFLRSRPPREALYWVGAAIGGTVISAHALRGGMSSEVHALTVHLPNDRNEHLVVRRYVRSGNKPSRSTSARLPTTPQCSSSATSIREMSCGDEGLSPGSWIGSRQASDQHGRTSLTAASISSGTGLRWQIGSPISGSNSPTGAITRGQRSFGSSDALMDCGTAKRQTTSSWRRHWPAPSATWETPLDSVRQRRVYPQFMRTPEVAEKAGVDCHRGVRGHPTKLRAPGMATSRPTTTSLRPFVLLTCRTQHHD